MSKIEAIKAYLVDLSEGDPVALALTAIPLSFGALIAFIAWRVRVGERRYEERRGRKPTTKKTH